MNTPSTRHRTGTTVSVPRSLTLLVLFLLWAVALTGALPAQENGEADLPSAPFNLTVEAIQKRMESLDKQENLKDKARDQIKAIYQEAINELNTASDLESQINEYKSIQKNASSQIEKYTRQREELLAAQDLKVPEDAPIDRLFSEIEKTGKYIPFEPSLSFLEQQLNDRQAELDSAQSRLEQTNQRLSRIQSRRENIQKFLNETKEKLDSVVSDLNALSLPETPTEQTVAELVRLLAQKQKLETRLEALNLEKKTYEPRRDVLQAEKNYLTSRVNRLEKRVQLWQKVVSMNVERKAREVLQETQRTLKQVKDQHPSIAELAREIKTLAQERISTAGEGPVQGLPGPIKGLQQVTERLKGTQTIRQSISSELSNVKERIQAAGLTHRLGRILRRKKNELPSASDHLGDVSTLENNLSDVQLRLIELSERKSALIQNQDERIEKLMSDLGPDRSKSQRQEIRARISDLMTRRLGLIEKLIEDYDRYFTKLTDLREEKRKLVDLLKSYRSYINERVIWIRSTTNFFHVYRENTGARGKPPVTGCHTPSGVDANVREVPEAVRCFFRLEHWTQTFNVLKRDVQQTFLLYLTVLLIFLVLLWYRSTYFARLRTSSEGTFSRYEDSILKTWESLFYTTLIIIPGPGLLLFFGWRLTIATAGDPNFARATGMAFTGTGLYFLTLSGLRHTCHPDGLGRNHFRWTEENTRLIRTNILYFLYPTIPLVWLFVLNNHIQNRFYRDSLGRTLFIVTMLMIAWFIQRTISPTRGIISDYLEEHHGGWLDRLRFLWYPLVVGVPCALALLCIFGYYYTARQLMYRLSLTIMIFLGLLCLVELFVRWQIFQNIQFAVKKRKERQQERAREEAKQDEEPEEDPEEDSTKQKSFSLPSVNEQTKQLMWSFFWLGLGAGIWLIWADVLPALSMLNEVELWSHPMQVVETVTGKGGETVRQTVEKQMPITLADVLLALVTLVMTVIITKNLPGLLEITILQYLPMDQGLRYAYKMISRYLIVLLGIMFIAASIGIRWDDVQWLAAAVSVGLGFGLQEIFANFVSGLIILFERPIRVGDTVTVNDVTGRVTRIRTRATTITDLDRKELIVPNRNFIQGELVNWTLSDSIMRVVIPIGVAYGSDIDLVEEKLMEITRREEIVLDDPEPNVIFTGFGDNALQFSLRFFIQDYDNYWTSFHTINRSVDKEFREAGITIAFPQRDLHLESVNDDVSVTFSPEQMPDPEDGGARSSPAPDEASEKNDQ